MTTFSTKLIATAAIAALICATPVSVDLVRTTTGGTQVTLAFDVAQAFERGARETAPRQATHNPGSRPAGDLRTNDVRANDVRASNVRANNIQADNVRANDIRANDIDVNKVDVNKVNVNNVDATRVDAAYVRPPYVARPLFAAGTAVAVGTTVAALPPACTVVAYDGTTYYHCGTTYFISANGAYVAVMPPL